MKTEFEQKTESIKQKIKDREGQLRHQKNEIHNRQAEINKKEKALNKLKETLNDQLELVSIRKKLHKKGSANRKREKRCKRWNPMWRKAWKQPTHRKGVKT